jgi:hypothetical protein
VVAASSRPSRCVLPAGQPDVEELRARQRRLAGLIAEHEAEQRSISGRG